MLKSLWAPAGTILAILLTVPCTARGQNWFKRGDVTVDGKLNIADPIALLSYRFLGTYKPGCLDAVDYDDSGVIDLSDAINGLTNLFLGGSPPAAPGMEACGPDPTPGDRAGDLGCQSYPEAACGSEQPDFRHWSFEDGTLEGWAPFNGTAFLSQPTYGNNIGTGRAMLGDDFFRNAVDAVGGDYWDVPYPIGIQGNYWIGTYENRPRKSDEWGGIQGDGPTGALLSPEFKLGRSYIHFLMGGGCDGNVRVELLVKQPGATSSRVATAVLGPCDERLERMVIDVHALNVHLPDGEGRRATARLMVYDLSIAPGGHINLDDVWVTDTPPSPADDPQQVWGIADLHAHPFNHMAFGGRLFHGSIHSWLSDSGEVIANAPSNVALALGDCHPSHGTGPFGNGVTTIVPMGGHDAVGWPSFRGWPRFTEEFRSHQQMYVDWLKRAWQGGVRIIQADVNNHEFLATVFDVVHSFGIPPMATLLTGDRTPNPTGDQWSIVHQTLAAYRFTELPDVKDWCAVARSAAEARAIVGAGKLALVLGIETDELGDLHDRPGGLLRGVTNEATIRTTIRNYLQDLHDAGIRHIIPIHLVDNVFGGHAIYNFIFLVHAALHRGTPPRIVNSFDNGVGGKGIYTRMDEAALFGASLTDVFNLRKFLDSQPILDALAGALGLTRLLDFYASVLQAIPAPPASGKMGHANGLGLNEPTGRILIEEMMRLGMIIDIDHMSERASNETLELAEAPGLLYPIISSHTGFRELSFGSWVQAAPGQWVHNVDRAFFPGTQFGTANHELLASERSRSGEQLERIRKLGGLVGVGTGPATVVRKWEPRDFVNEVENDGDGTTKAFAQNYLYAVDKLEGRGVAIGTDMNAVPGTMVPRFGTWSSWPSTNPAQDIFRNVTLKDQVAAQRNGVRYDIPARQGHFDDVCSSFEGAPDTQPGRAYDVAECIVWRAISYFYSDTVLGPPGGDFYTEQREIQRLAWGFELAQRGAQRPSGWPDTLADMRVAWDVYHGIVTADADIAPDYSDRVRRIWRRWHYMEGDNRRLKRCVTGNMHFDFNVDGLAHYGLIPDMLQDLKNVGVTPEQLAPLFRSAEHFIQMWEKAEKASEEARRRFR